VVTGVRVEVGKSALVNVSLEVGGMTETVEVSATGLQLQTLDATMGNVLDSNLLSQLPTLSRDATSCCCYNQWRFPASTGLEEAAKETLAADQLQGRALIKIRS